MVMETGFIKSAIRLFQYYKSIGEKAMEQLTEDQLLYKLNEESNSISILVQHLHGNMLSRWTDFLSSDGEKEWRERDKEFEEQKIGKQEILKLWNEGWDLLFRELGRISEDDLSKTVYIRKEPFTAMEAIIKQLGHYPYHIGQIVFIAKLLKNKEWQNLSIPKNKSR
jgi:hypothetical protein